MHRNRWTRDRCAAKPRWPKGGPPCPTRPRSTCPLPFDSGAFASKRYPNYINMMDLNDFETGSDPEAPHKLIGTFFTTARNYYRLTARPKEQFEALFDVDVLDEEMKALHKLIQHKDRKFDDRRFAIEVQFEQDIDLTIRQPVLAIFPETYLANQKYIRQNRCARVRNSYLSRLSAPQTIFLLRHL